MDHCDLIIGVKEVNLEDLIPNKSYMFFSHTFKKQSYNRILLQDILKKKIRLIDYEVIKNKKNVRPNIFFILDDFVINQSNLLF